jgi:hypothetical protein
MARSACSDARAAAVPLVLGPERSIYPVSTALTGSHRPPSENKREEGVACLMEYLSLRDPG